MAQQEPKIIEIPFPTGGLVRAMGFNAPPPGWPAPRPEPTTPYAVNVRAFDPISGRRRGGSRPGLTKLFAGQLGSGNPVSLMDLVSSDLPGGLSTNMLVAITSNGKFYYAAAGASAMTAITSWTFNPATGLQGAQVGLNYYVADYRPASLPTLAGTDGVLSTSYNQLASPSYPSWPTGITPGVDVLYIAHSQSFIAANPSQTYSTGTIAVNGGIATLTGGSGFTAGMVGGNQTVYNSDGSVLETTPIQAYIDSTHLTVGDLTLTVAAGATYQVTYSFDAEDNIFPITSVSGGYINFSGTMTPDGGGMVWQIGRLPQVFNPTAGTLAKLSPSYGLPPLNCPLACVYKGRLVLAGPGPLWYMSYVRDATNWDYGANPADLQRAIAGPDTEGGIGQPITALMPHSDQYLILACTDQLWVLNGDPAYGGQLQNLSRDVGCLGPNAWCALPDGSIMLLSRSGLYLVPPGAQQPPVEFSREKLPAELINIDPTANTISMVYDVYRRAVHLAITPNSGVAGIDYWIDWPNQSFWPVVYGATTLQPASLFRYAAGAGASLPGASRVLLGGLDGYIRWYDETATQDDGHAFACSILFGPVRPAGPGWEAQLITLTGETDAGSGAVSWGLFCDSTIQAIVAAVQASGSPLLAGSWSGGLNHIAYPGCRGAALAVMLSGTGPWATESIWLQVRKGGKLL